MRGRLQQNLDLLVGALGEELRRMDELERRNLLLENQLRAAQGSHLAKAARAQNAGIPESPPFNFPGGRAAVVSWDMGHNPVGRAYVLYRLLAENWDPVLIGPGWSRYGRDLWEPLRGATIDSRIFPCRSLLDYYSQAALEAVREKFALVYVSKPRLPSLFLGFLIKEHSGCPLVLDIDDHELSFFTNQLKADLAQLRNAGHSALFEPFEELSTRFAESLIPYADAVTVSNIALRNRFGGVIIRHARDENAFDPARFNRTALRRELNIAEDEFALVFVGTIRPHKGLAGLLAAIDSIADPKISLHIAGNDAAEKLRDMMRRFPNARVVQHPDCSFEDLPRLLCAADCIPLLQDADDAISRYQIPSKISDATSMGIPVLVTDVPPIRDLRELPGLQVTTRGALKEAILKLKAERDDLDGARIRAGFLSEFSEGVNRARLSLAISEIRSVKPVPEEIHGVRAAMQTAFADAVARNQQSFFPIPAVSKPTARRTNIAFFWKQNDTGLYGRRSDMIAKHLLRAGEIDKILFFDAPISIGRVSLLANNARRSPQDQSSRILRNTIARWKRGLDDGRLLQRSFIYRSGDTTKLLGQDLPDESDFPEFVAQEMAEAGFDASNTIAWVCPVVWPFPELHKRIGFRACVADIIDDQRSWDIDRGHRRKLDESYRQTLSLADIVLANCAPVAKSFQSYARAPISVVPNGAERFDKIVDDVPLMEGLRSPGRPTIGYAGTLRDRIDWNLLAELVQSRPDWSFVVAGSAEENPNVTALAKFANVRFLGVVEYPNLPSFLRSIDVAIVPHVINELTNAMNPLKIYNYLAAGVPIVSTEAPNINELASFIHVAHNAKEFESAIAACLADNPSVATSASRSACLEEISWESRVDAILGLLRPYLRESPEA